MFHRIVVGFDGSSASRSALLTAATLAAADATITVATVAVERAETGLATGIDALTDAPGTIRVLQDEARDLLHHRDGVAVVAPVGASVGEALHRFGTAHDADLLVVGAGHLHGYRRALAGSDAEDTIHGAICPVCVVPAQEPRGLRRIGVGFDGSDASRPVVDVAASLAVQNDAALTVTTVVDPGIPPGDRAAGAAHADDARRALYAEVARIGAGPSPFGILSTGDPTSHLLRAARELDLLVLGARARGPVLRHLLGSVADDVVRLAPCPVLVVPETVAVAAIAAFAGAAPVRRGVSW